MRLANGNERHPQAKVVVVISQAVDFVVRDELDAIEVGGVPAAAFELDLNLALVDAGLDDAGASRLERPFRLSNAQRSFQGGVIQVARAAKLRIVLVAYRRIAAGEEVLVGVQD